MKNSILRILLFVASLAVVYVVWVGCLVSVHLRDGLTPLERLLGHHLQPGGYGHSLIRFREIEDYRDLDILFVGSSHAYRGFDPRIFTEANLMNFNIGSSNQTPVNSYFLLKKYWKTLKPNLVVYEIYPDVLDNNGLESFYDLSANLPFSKEIIAMALAVEKIDAINALVGIQLERLHKPLGMEKQREIQGDRYVAGGYVEHNAVLDSLNTDTMCEVIIHDKTLDYLRKIIRFVKQEGAEIVLVSHPIPTEVYDSKHFKSASNRISEIARNEGILYFDFNEYLLLDTYRFFYDDHHLNAQGVHIFNSALLDSLQNHFIEPGHIAAKIRGVQSSERGFNPESARSTLQDGVLK